jgi:hypothetical protein
MASSAIGQPWSSMAHWVAGPSRSWPAEAPAPTKPARAEKTARPTSPTRRPLLPTALPATALATSASHTVVGTGQTAGRASVRVSSSAPETISRAAP